MIACSTSPAVSAADSCARTSRAFGLDAALAQLPALEERKNALSANGSAPGSGRVGLSLSTFFDLYFEVARDVLAHPLLPEVLVEGTQPAVRSRELMNQRKLEYYLRFDQRILECAGSCSSYDLIAWLPLR